MSHTHEADATPRHRRAHQASPADRMPHNAQTLATGRQLVSLGKVDFAAILTLAEPLSATAQRLTEWEHAGLIGDTGAALLRKLCEQWSALEVALAAAGLADHHTAWLVEDPRREVAARAMRNLADDVRRGHLGIAWQLTHTDGERLTYTEEPMADLTPAVLAKRLALAVELLGEVAAAEGQWRGSAPEAASGGLRKRRRWRLRVRGQSLLLDGEPVPIDLTAEARAVTLCYLGHLIRAQGEWVSGSEIDLAEKQQPNEGLAGHRWDRIRKRLPDALRSLIETNRRKGYRLSGEALA